MSDKLPNALPLSALAGRLEAALHDVRHLQNGYPDDIWAAHGDAVADAVEAMKERDALRDKLQAIDDALEAGPRFPRFLGPAQAAVMGTGWDACAEAVRQAMRGEG